MRRAIAIALTMLVFGILVSLPLVVFGSGAIGWMMGRWIWIVWLGGGILGLVAGEMMITDPMIHGWLGPTADVLHHPVRFGLFLLLVGLGWWFTRREHAKNLQTVEQ